MNNLKYTDRDVRENPETFREYVLNYLESYQGEFEFLIDCKMRIASGLNLSTGMIRGVLNCMRVDPRLPYDLPDPLPIEEGTVVSIETRRPKVEVKQAPKWVCPYIGTEHDLHYGEDEDGFYRHCVGWHAINRDISYTRARFHANYLRGKNSNLIHRSAHEGEICWFPPFHSYGNVVPTFWRVETCCPIAPLKNPLLLNADDVKAAKPFETKTKYKEVTLCPRCFPTGEKL